MRSLLSVFVISPQPCDSHYLSKARVAAIVEAASWKPHRGSHRGSEEACADAYTLDRKMSEMMKMRALNLP